MLVFVRLFGGTNESLVLLVTSSSTVGEFKRILKLLRPRVPFRRFLFAGRELSDDSQTLGNLNVIRRECKESFAKLACVCIRGLPHHQGIYYTNILCT